MLHRVVLAHVLPRRLLAANKHYYHRTTAHSIVGSVRFAIPVSISRADERVVIALNPIKKKASL